MPIPNIGMVMHYTIFHLAKLLIINIIELAQSLNCGSIFVTVLAITILTTLELFICEGIIYSFLNIVHLWGKKTILIGNHIQTTFCLLRTTRKYENK